MAKEVVEKYFVRRLQTVLTEYLKDFSQNNVAKFHLGISNNILLENLSIRKDVLMKFHIPMYIVDGKIGRIKMSMPFNYKSTQSQMLIENLDLTVSSIGETSMIGLVKDGRAKRAEGEQGLSDQENFKKQKLRLWEEKMIKYFEALSPPNWIQQIVDSIYDNMSITIKRFNLTFQNTSLMGYETSLKIKFDELHIQTTDSEWNHKFNSDPKSIYKLITLSKFCVTLNATANQESHHMNVGNSMRENESYIIHPLDLEIKLTQRKTVPNTQTPFNTLQISIKNSLIFVLNREQKKYLMKLNMHMKNLEIIQDNFHFRPQVPVNKNWIEWWKYSMQAVLEKQKQFKVDLKFSSQRIVYMKRYISLYKRKQNIIHVPWLTQWTIQNEERFQNCEKVLQLKDLIKYREWAFTEIRLEAKRYFNSSKDGSGSGKGVKPLLDIWTKAINTQNAFKDIDKFLEDDVPVELEEGEKINLYEILERDTSNILNMYLQGHSQAPEQRQLEVNFSLSTLLVLLFENRGAQQVVYSVENTRMHEGCRCNHCLNQQNVSENGRFEKRQEGFLRRQSYLAPVLHRKKSNIGQELSEQDSFMTAKAQDEEVDSFKSDIKDLEENGIAYENDQEKFDNYNVESGNFNKLPNQPLKRCMRLFLIIEMRFIQVGIFTQLDQKVQSQKPFSVGELRVLSPGYLSKYLLEDRLDDSVILRNNSVEMLMEVFHISITKDPVFLNSDQNFKYLIQFLTSNRLKHYADFLELYERDKNYFQNFNEQNFTPYLVFIEPKSPEYLHRSFSVKKLSHGLQYSSILEQLHSGVCEQIKRNLFPAFLEEYGEWILPPCLEYLIMKGEFKNKKQKNFVPELEVQFILQGKRPEFQVIQNNKESQKKQTTEQIEEETQNQSEVKVKTERIKFNFTTRSLQSLMNFLDDPGEKQVSPESLFVNQNNLLLDCIMRSQTLNTNIITQPIINFSIVFERSIKIFILSEAMYVRRPTKIKLQLTNFMLQSVLPAQILKEYSKIPNIGSLFERHHHYYSFIQARMEDFTLSHRFIPHQQRCQNQNSKSNSRKPHVSQIKDLDEVSVLSFGMNLLIVSSLVPNHASLTDKKLYIQIPSMRIELTDNVTGLLELVQILGRSDTNENKTPQNQRDSSIDNEVQNEAAYLHSADSILVAELKSLVHDHVDRSLNCRHCIVKFRKSTSLLNLVVGDLTELLQQNRQLEATWFSVLQEVGSQVWSSQKQEHLKLKRLKHHNMGLEIEFNTQNRASCRITQASTVLVLPLLIVTRDQGFFKDNITVICKKSWVPENGVKIEQVHVPMQDLDGEQNMTQVETNFIGVEPYQEESPDVLSKLDERHVFYCRSLESRLFRQDQLNEHQDLVQRSPDNQLYLLALMHVPLRVELLKEAENQTREKNTKTQLFFRLRSINLNFMSPIAACTVITIISQAKYAMSIIDFAESSIYHTQMPRNNPPEICSAKNQSPLKQLDALIILVTLSSMQVNVEIGPKEKFVNYKAQNILFKYNLELLDSTEESRKISAMKHTEIPKQPLMDIHRSQVVFSSIKLPVQIFSCVSIRVNFSGDSILHIQDTSIYRQQNAVTVNVAQIKILNKNSQHEFHNLMMIPKSQNLGKAVVVKLEFVSGLTEINIQMTPMTVTLSKENIQEFIYSSSIIFVILLQEMREYKSFLKRQVYQSRYTNSQNMKTEFFKLNKDQQDAPYQYLKQKKILSYHVTFTLEEISVLFSKEGTVFCELKLNSIHLTQKHNTELEAVIKSAAYHPYPSLGLQNKQKPLYYNLIAPNNDNTSIKIRLMRAMSGSILIQLENIVIKGVSVYLNELAAFMKSIEDEYNSTSLKNMLSIKKPKERQVVEELERQLRTQSKIRVHVLNSSVLVPENSTSNNYIRLYFRSAEVLIKKHKINIQAPLLDCVSQSGSNMAVDYAEETESRALHTTNISITLEDMETIYNLVVISNRPQGQLFKTSKLLANIDVPLISPMMFGKWQYDQTIKVNLHNLNLQLDLGKMTEIQRMVDRNTEEKSKLFDFKPQNISKINFSVNIDSMNLGMEKFTYQSIPVKLFRDEDPEDLELEFQDQ